MNLLSTDNKGAMKKMNKNEMLQDARRYIFKNESNNKVIAVIKSVSKSGMSRRIKFYYHDGARCLNITRLIATINGYSINNNGEMLVSGCGMDMVFNTLYNFNNHCMNIENNKVKGGEYKYIVDSSNYDLL